MEKTQQKWEQQKKKTLNYVFNKLFFHISIGKKHTRERDSSLAESIIMYLTWKAGCLQALKGFGASHYSVS